MNTKTLVEFFESDQPIPNREIAKRLSSTDIPELGILQQIIYRRWKQITPSPNIVDCYTAVARYFLLCIERNPEPDDFVHSRYSAARELVRLVQHWDHGAQWKQWKTELHVLLKETLDNLRTLYLRSDQETRLCIETGFLEHFLENPTSQQWFKNWENDPVTATAVTNSLQWSAGKKLRERE